MKRGFAISAHFASLDPPRMLPKGIDLLPYRIGHQFGIIQFNMMTAVFSDDLFAVG